MDLLHACLMIVASICFSGDAKVETHRGWTWTGATITIGETTIHSRIGSDNIIAIDESRMERKCVDDRCFFYATSCDPDALQTACEMWYGLSSCDEEMMIDFKAPDWLSLKNVKAELYFVPFDGAGIPFDSLNYKPPALPSLGPQESRKRRNELYERCKTPAGL